MANLDGLRNAVIERAVARTTRAAGAAVDATRAAASRRSGALAESIEHSTPVVSGERVLTEISATSDHARFQDEGTGIYGPRGARIFPTTAKVLRFYSPAAGKVIFARSVAGAPGTHFFHQPMAARWRDALEGAA